MLSAEAQSPEVGAEVAPHYLTGPAYRRSSLMIVAAKKASLIGHLPAACGSHSRRTLFCRRLPASCSDRG